MTLFDILSGVGNVLDTPGAMVRTGLAGENPFAAVFDTDKRVSGRGLLEQYGLAGENTDQGWIPDAGDIAGFAVEALLDPTNLIGLGAAKKAAQAAKAATQAENVSRLGKYADEAGQVISHNALSEAQRANRFMPEEVAELTKIKGDDGLPRRLYHGTAFSYDNYDPAFDGGNNLYGPGYYQTDSPRVASGGYIHKGIADAARRAQVDEAVYSPWNQARMAYNRAANRSTRLRQLDRIVERSGPAPEWMDYEARPAALLERFNVSPSDIKERLAQRTQQATAALSAQESARAARDAAIAEASQGSPQVRMTFTDSRVPLNIDSDHAIADLPPSVIQAVARSDARRYSYKIDQLERSKPGFHSTNTYERLLKANDGSPAHAAAIAAWKAIAEEDDLARSVIDQRINEIASSYTLPAWETSIRGQQIYDSLGTNGLRDAGYDAITHAGGQIVGDVDHNVTIAFDPSQIYKPYIAKKYRQLPQLPQLLDTPSPSHRKLMAALLGEHALTRPEWE